MGEVMKNFIIPERAQKYLYIQKGGIATLKADRLAWQDAYETLMVNEFESIKPYLPAECHATLDIGGGMGGINILINRHYGGELAVEILDGRDDRPAVHDSSQTYSNAKAVQEFMQVNGVSNFLPLWPGDDMPDSLNGAVDLLTSFGSWCFHYEPRFYLSYCRTRIHKDTTIILDVRKNRPAWREQLDVFTLVDEIDLAEKYTRCIFKPKS